MEDLKNIVSKFIDYNVKLVVLFGSRARGDYSEESDIDVLIVADGLPGDPREAFEIVMRRVDPRVHTVCFRTSSFLKKLEDESTFIMEILEDGKIIYADRDFMEEVMLRYRSVRSRWIRRGRMWERIDSNPR